MKIVSKLFDERINSYNLLLEISYKKYLEIAKVIINNNEYQRRRVKASSSVYSLLKIDLSIGCLLPPIVLALSKIETLDLKNISDEEIIEQINRNVISLVILDGLQRTYTILDLEEELSKRGDSDSLDKLYTRTIRVEIYIGINKVGILYRMLTLNTGQTPMSMRHQVEILYSDYLKYPPPGITLLTERDEEKVKNMGEYKFKDIIEGFSSYLERSELPIDRQDILTNIQSLETLSKENPKIDLFNEYLITFNNFISKMIEIAGDWTYKEQDESKAKSSNPFGKRVQEIFKKPQVMAGFGAAAGRLIDKKIIAGLEDIKNDINKISFEGDIFLGMDSLILNLERVRFYAKKIGNEQRAYFNFFFRELFDNKGDAYLHIDKAIEEAYKMYERKSL